MKIEQRRPLTCDLYEAGASDSKRNVQVSVTASRFSNTVNVFWSGLTGGSHVVLTSEHADALMEMLSAATLALSNNEVKQREELAA